MYYSIEDRRQVILEKESGKSLIQISQERKMSYSTLKRIWQSYKKSGASGLELKYTHCGPKAPKYYRIYRMSTWLKRRHPNWGAPYILTLLHDKYPLAALPTARTLQKWFRAKGFNKTFTIREPSKTSVVQQVHDCWQIDAKEKLKLEDQTKACYLTTVDVKSGAVLETPVFPLRKY